MTFVTVVVRCLVDALTGEKQYKFEEILPIYKQVSADAESGTFADFMEAFKTFDREGQGFINAAELRHVLTSLGIADHILSIIIIITIIIITIVCHLAMSFVQWLLRRLVRWRMMHNFS